MNLIYAAFMARWTAADWRRYAEVEARHYLDTCPFVEAVRDVERPAWWYDVDRYVGERTRCTVVGNVVVRNTRARRADGVYSTRSSVAGEIA